MRGRSSSRRHARPTLRTASASQQRVHTCSRGRSDPRRSPAAQPTAAPPSCSPTHASAVRVHSSASGSAAVAADGGRLSVSLPPKRCAASSHAGRAQARKRCSVEPCAIAAGAGSSANVAPNPAALSNVAMRTSELSHDECCYLSSRGTLRCCCSSSITCFFGQRRRNYFCRLLFPMKTIRRNCFTQNCFLLSSPDFFFLFVLV